MPTQEPEKELPIPQDHATEGGVQSLKDRVAVVTGASAGIGRSTALKLAGEGASVVLAARRSERLHELATLINSDRYPGRAVAVQTDIEHEEQIRSLRTTTEQAFGPAAVLINNAGCGYVSPVHEIDARQLDRILRVNLRGAILCAKHFLPPMLTRKYGTIVNVGSVSSRRGWPTGTPYVASKFALRGFSECLRAEARHAKIRVLMVDPGFVSTELFAAMGCELPFIDQALDPDVVADLIVTALKLPQDASITELEVTSTIPEG